jgi:hypothetical protein
VVAKKNYEDEEKMFWSRGETSIKLYVIEMKKKNMKENFMPLTCTPRNSSLNA